MSEHDEAVELAKRILDRPYTDPDDDLAMLSRQFLREKEKTKAMTAENIDFTVCVQAADDFDPLPSLEDRVAMLERVVEEFRKFLRDRDRKGQVIIGFRMNQ